MPITHTLANGAVICGLSPHDFRFSDGTKGGAQVEDLVKFFTLSRDYRKVGEVRGMSLNEVRMVLSQDQLDKLQEIAASVDLVVVPFPVLTALREQGVRAQYPNVVAFNATQETQRSAPQDKIVDIDNWSY